MANVKPINLALQGGGAHGAFTWGVLDHLLADPRVEFGWISGTSAGAINAVAMAAGLAEGGREGARAKLAAVWEAIHKAGVPDFLKFNPLLSYWSSSPGVANMARMFSPSDMNPMGFDPLRRLLEEHIDFARLRAECPVELLIVATEVATGRPRYFRRDELTIDAVLASACLPTFHHPVMIDGRAYWDGGFSANPDIIRLAQESPVGDTVIVLLNTTVKSTTPTTVEEIVGETNRLTFNAPLMRDVEIIETVRECQGGVLSRRFGRGSHLSPLARHRYHLIESGRHTSVLPAASKMKPDWGMFTYLHNAGRSEAYKWLDGTHAAIGRYATVDLKARFLAPLPNVTLVLPAHSGSGKAATTDELLDAPVPALAPPMAAQDGHSPQ